MGNNNDNDYYYNLRDENSARDSLPNEIKAHMIEKESDVLPDDVTEVREKKDLFEDEKRAIFDYYNNIRKKTSVFGTRKDANYKKVQVQEEETGTQRVQVNAGYENPRIACESGYNSCAGVILKWVLTLYGTGE